MNKFTATQYLHYEQVNNKLSTVNTATFSPQNSVILFNLSLIPPTKFTSSHYKDIHNAQFTSNFILNCTISPRII